MEPVSYPTPSNPEFSHLAAEYVFRTGRRDLDLDAITVRPHKGNRWLITLGNWSIPEYWQASTQTWITRDESESPTSYTYPLDEALTISKALFTKTYPNQVCLFQGCPNEGTSPDNFCPKHAAKEVEVANDVFSQIFTGDSYTLHLPTTLHVERGTNLKLVSIERGVGPTGRTFLCTVTSATPEDHGTVVTVIRSLIGAG